MHPLIGVCVGIGLSATCGFRIFVPMFFASIAANTGHLPVAGGFEWLGSPVALLIFSIATIVEILGYFVPFVDHFLDAIAIPVSTVAGYILTASHIIDLPPALQWSAGVIGAVLAGGSTTGVATLRTAVTAATGGVGNPLFSLFETFFAFVSALMAMVVPIVALLAIATGLFFSWRFVRKLGSKKRAEIEAERREEVLTFAGHIKAEIQRVGPKKFDLETFAEEMGVDEQITELAAEAVFWLLCRKVMADGVISAKEQRSLDSVASVLGLRPKAYRRYLKMAHARYEELEASGPVELHEVGFGTDWGSKPRSSV